ncbi:hypothetical protein FACS189418_5640 [Clostridia bacterium]|nr:hypothetical protein FACS189418_5640 [Clostridia bacterium]
MTNKKIILEKTGLFILDIFLLFISLILFIIIPYEEWGGRDKEAIELIRVFFVLFFPIVLALTIVCWKKKNVISRVIFFITGTFLIYKLVSTF